MVKAYRKRLIVYYHLVVELVPDFVGLDLVLCLVEKSQSLCSSTVSWSP